MANHSQSESTIARGEDTQHQKMLVNWILRDKLYSSYCIKLPMLPRPIADKRWRQPKGFRVSFTPPRIGSRS